jgi:hypothetical protein
LHIFARALALPKFPFARAAAMTTVRRVTLRRLFALMLALTCALAPASGAWDLASLAADEDCCCGTKCPCPPTECAPAPLTRTASPSQPATTAEQRSIAAKPRARVATTVFLRFVSAPFQEPATSVRQPHAATPDGLAPADSVALFKAHCSFLI